MDKENNVSTNLEPTAEVIEKEIKEPTKEPIEKTNEESTKKTKEEPTKEPTAEVTSANKKIKDKKIKGSSSLWLYLCLAVIVALQLVRITVVFSQRQGLHSDETWSYGYANSYYDPYMYLVDVDRPYEDGVPNQNLDEWISGSVYKDYLVVNDGEAFDFKSVISNLRGDMHPYLHDMLLHFVCSFFPNSFSVWYSFLINIVSFILTQFFLFKLAQRISKKNWLALFTCFFYGFSYAAVNTFVYLRSYALLTAIVLGLVWCLYSIYDKKFENIRLELIGAFVFTVLGSLTHYYFYVFAFFITLLLCIYLLCKKRIKKMFIFGLTMLAGVIVSLILNPWAFPNMLGVDFSEIVSYVANLGKDGNVLQIIVQNKPSAIRYPYYWNLSTCFTLVLWECCGLRWDVNRVTFVYIELTLLTLVIVGVLLSFLFRNEPWFRKFVRNVISFIKNWKRHFLNAWKKINWGLIILFLTVLFYIMIIPKVSSVEGMGILTDRYLFMLMPVFSALLLTALYSCTGLVLKLKGKKLKINWAYIRNGVFAVLALMLLGLNLVDCQCNYMFDDGVDEAPLEDLTQDSDVILITNKGWRLEWYAGVLYKTDNCINVLADNFLDDFEIINDHSIAAGKSAYLVLEEDSLYSDTSQVAGMPVIVDDEEEKEKKFTEEEIITLLKKNVDWIEDIELLYERESFCGPLKIYKIQVK